MCRYLTAGGLSRLQFEAAALRTAIQSHRTDMVTGESSRNADTAMDWIAPGQSLEVLKRMLRDREDLLANTTTANPPRQCALIEFGHMIRVSHAGGELVFVLGAEKEPQGYQYNGKPVNTYWSRGEFGQEFLPTEGERVRKGDEVIVPRYQNQEDVTMKVMEIIIPTPDHMLYDAGTAKLRLPAAA